MAGINRTVSRVGLVLIIAATVAFSASCGCGGGSSGPPAPNQGRYYPDNYHSYDYYPTEYYPRANYYNRDYYFHSDDRKYVNWAWHPPINSSREILYSVHELLQERWLTGAGYLEHVEHNRIRKGLGTELDHWSLLTFMPDCEPFSEPDAAGVARAVYAISSGGLEQGEVYLELGWEAPPEFLDTCWIGVYRHGETSGIWNWFHPNEDMRISLSPIWQYRNDDFDGRISIAVVVAGYQTCVLKEVALREYANRW